MMRYQFALIFIVMVGGVVVADDNLEESKAIEKIELLGGKACRDHNQPDMPVVTIK